MVVGALWREHLEVVWLDEWQSRRPRLRGRHPLHGLGLPVAASPRCLRVQKFAAKSLQEIGFTLCDGSELLLDQLSTRHVVLFNDLHRHHRVVESHAKLVLQELLGRLGPLQAAIEDAGDFIIYVQRLDPWPRDRW